MKTIQYYISKANALVDEFHKACEEQDAKSREMFDAYKTGGNYFTPAHEYDEATKKAKKAFNAASRAVKECYIVLDTTAPEIDRYDSRNGIDQALFTINCWHNKIQRITNNQ